MCTKLMLHISEFRVKKHVDKGGFPIKFKIMNERHVINVKVERKQRRTGLKFFGLFLSYKKQLQRI